MPRIEEYTPQTEAQGPVGGTSPNLEEVQAAGRGISDFGKQITEGAQLINNRQQQAEESEVSANIYNQRANYTDRVKAETASGTIDSGKILEDFDKDAEDQYNNISTSGAQNTFTRQNARLRSSIAIMAARGQSTVAGNNAVAEYKNGLTTNSNVITADPNQFDSVHASMLDDIDTKVANGSLPAAQADKMKLEAGKTLSQAAIGGMIKSDYDSAVGDATDLINKNPNTAIKGDALKAGIEGYASAKTKLDDGTFDQYLNANDKKQLYGQIKQSQNAAYTEVNRLVTVQKAAQQEEAQNWQDANANKILTNGLSTAEVLKAPLSLQQKEQTLNMMRANSREQVSDPQVKNSLLNRMTAPDSDPNKISDPAQLMPYVGKGISTQDYNQLNSWFDKTPQGQVLTTNRKMIMDVAKANLVKAPIMGMPDPDGEYNLSQFTQALQKKESDLRAQKLPVDSLYDTGSKDYFASPQNLSKYQRTPIEIMQAQAAKATGSYVPPQQIQTNPGVQQDMVSVVGPNGQSGRIPRANLNKAIANGYKAK